MTTPNKEFFQWIYNRLVDVHKENPNVDYMISLKKRIEELPFDEPFWKPSEEQMKALEQWLKDKQYDGDSRYVYPIFESLYKQLKSCSYENNR